MPDTSLKGVVATEIRKRILRGECKPGERLVQHVIAQQLGVSGAPVREALVQLEREGLARAYPRRGYEVATANGRDAWEIYSLRGTLEQMAIQLALPQLTSSDLEELERILRRMARIGAADLLKAVELDQEFHAHLVDRCGHRRLREAWHHLDTVLMAMFFTITHRLPLRPSQMADVHQPLLTVLQTGDLDAAGAAFLDHYLSRAVLLKEE